jgi:hypothetical protein
MGRLLKQKKILCVRVLARVGGYINFGKLWTRKDCKDAATTLITVSVHSTGLHALLLLLNVNDSKIISRTLLGLLTRLLVSHASNNRTRVTIARE